MNQFILSYTELILHNLTLPFSPKIYSGSKRGANSYLMPLHPLTGGCSTHIQAGLYMMLHNADYL